jgi:3-oxoacyl-[acyl-carrier protein] reductase
VTGAAGGAGSAAVEVFARGGASVAAVVHERPLPSELDGLDGVRTFTCDIADRDDVIDTFARIAADLGGIDALIHTAAVEELVAAADIDATRLERMLGVNVGGTIFTNQAAHAHMRAGGGGSIVNFHSIAGIRGFPMLGHYAASKAAVAGWTRVAAIEWGADNVRVNAIAPVMLTPMAKNYRSTLGPDELDAFLESMRQVIHVNAGEYGDPREHIAPVLRFLTSDDARYITGQTISVDGGWVKLGS